MWIIEDKLKAWHKSHLLLVYFILCAIVISGDFSCSKLALDNDI